MLLFVVDRVVFIVRVIVHLGVREVMPSKASEEYSSIAERDDIPLDGFRPELAPVFSGGTSKRCFILEEIRCYAKSF